MKKYNHLTEEERYTIGSLLCMKATKAEIARILNRHPSSIGREIKRNTYQTDGSYKALHAISMASGRRTRSRQGTNFTHEELRSVNRLIRQDFSPEQVSGYLKRTGELSISHETIYRHIIEDKRQNGTLFKHLRCARKQRRKRYGHYDSRGRLAGKRGLAERPPGATNRSRTGHVEIDTVMGKNRGCILTLVDRKTGYLWIGKLPNKTAGETNRKLQQLLDRNPDRVRTITSDNGCEFHGYADVEESHGIKFYFARPYHSWERGTNENTNGLIRQYLPKGMCLDKLSQGECDRIADKLNARPRKRLNFYSPAEKFL